MRVRILGSNHHYPVMTAHPSKWSLRLCLTGCCLTLLAGTSAAQTLINGNLRAGAAKVDITPKPEQLQTVTDVIRDHIYARAIVVDDGKSCAVLIGLDVDNDDDVGVPRGIELASASTGCPTQNFIVSATHNHSSNTLGLGAGFPDAKQKRDAIVAVANAAKARLAPAQFGYGTTQLDLNVNRDRLALKRNNDATLDPEFPLDKTLAVVEFLGADNLPIGIYMNYAMHPVNFNGVGVISGDFPGEASRYLETLFDDHTVAIYSQGAEGDVGPAYDQGAETLRRLLHGQVMVAPFGIPSAPEPLHNLVVAKTSTGPGHPEVMVNRRTNVAPEKLADYHRAIDLVGYNIIMMGTLIGDKTLSVMRSITPLDHAQISGARAEISCPGRTRDTEKPVRPNELPAYKGGPDVSYTVEALRIGNLGFAAVNTELYTSIGTHLKAASPADLTIVVGLANGKSIADYTYPDYAADRKVFEVAGSHLRPGCAEDKIVAAATELMRRIAQ